MLTAQLMASMDDSHLIAAVRCEQDSLASTALEEELLNRFERLVAHAALIDIDEEHEINTDALKSVLEHSLDFPTIARVLDVLSEFSVETPEALRTKLERADKFYDLAQEASDVFANLNDLVQSTL